MKNIFLIGDSIRCGSANSPGYGIYVKEKLKGSANIYAPGTNCRFAQYTLRYLHEWARDVTKADIDVVHWNNGLWDLVHILGDEALTDVDMYVRVLHRVYKRIRQLFPHAKIIFASNTAVYEPWASPDFCRYNHEIEAYNQAAAELMLELNVEVNDLYSVTKNWDEKMYADHTHFKEEGARILADHVIEKIMAE